MPEEHKRLDALVVDVEDSTTLLKLYIGRLMKAPSRTMFYAPLVEQSSEILGAVAALDRAQDGRDHLVRIASALVALAREISVGAPAKVENVLTLQEGVDLLEAQLDHMLRLEQGAAPEVVASIEQLEARIGAAPQHDAEPADSSGAHRPSIEEIFEEDPFDEFALTDEFLDELVDGFDAALDASIASPEPVVSASPVAEPAHVPEYRHDPSETAPGSISLTESEEAALKELFGQIASAYVGPITDFVGKLRVGPVTTAWVDLCLPAVMAMVRASASMEYTNIERALGAFADSLEDVRANARVVDGDNRAHLLATYQNLAELLPATFPIVEPDSSAESESIILNSLLKQIKGVGRITIARLFAAGLVALDAYYVADAGDLAAAAGLRPSLAETICERFRTYREVAELASDADIVTRRLEGLVEDLRAAQFEFKKATLEEWYTHAPSRAKAKARRGRQQCMWKINVALAELGAVEFLNEIKDDIYDKRIERLEAFVGARRARASGEAAV
jgi:hypothetical protein